MLRFLPPNTSWLPARPPWGHLQPDPWQAQLGDLPLPTSPSKTATHSDFLLVLSHEGTQLAPVILPTMQQPGQAFPTC